MKFRQVYNILSGWKIFLDFLDLGCYILVVKTIGAARVRSGFTFPESRAGLGVLQRHRRLLWALTRPALVLSIAEVNNGDTLQTETKKRVRLLRNRLCKRKAFYEINENS